MQKIHGETGLRNSSLGFALIPVAAKSPDTLTRVVLIDFSSPEMKPVGLVTRVMKDTPNPTSGYLEIIPLDRVTSTDWSLDEAMAFIMSGGAVAPDSMNYDQLTAKKE